ncbi:MAG: hypothetical protein HRT57_08005 [Crocinitomicaceae bacterium]|nr:hypothetical protein [Crocinitomicaceae bacterium]
MHFCIGVFVLWEEFLKTWKGNQMPLPFGSFEDQNARYDDYIVNIPNEVLNIGLEKSKL